MATYSGNLFTRDTSAGVDKASISLLGQIGSRVDDISYLESRDSFVALSSYETNGTEQQITSPGSLIFSKQSNTCSTLEGSTWLQNYWSSQILSGQLIGFIRRPCN